MRCSVGCRRDPLHGGMQIWSVVPNYFRREILRAGSLASTPRFLTNGRWNHSIPKRGAQHRMDCGLVASSCRGAQLYSAPSISPSSVPRTAEWGHACKPSRVQLRLKAPQLAFSSAANASRRPSAEPDLSAGAAGSTDAAADKPAPKKRGRKKKTVEAAELQRVSRRDTGAVLPAVDLAANVPQSGDWASVKRWVVFSDLHVSHKTVDVACQVLRRVREEAVARDAGVLFLGKTPLTLPIAHMSPSFKLLVRPCDAVIVPDFFVRGDSPAV